MKLVPITRKSELSDCLAVFIGGCRDDYALFNELFPEPIYSLNSLAENLHAGIDTIFDKPKHAEARAKMHERLDQIHTAFREKRFNEGFALCHGVHELIAETKIR